jgi:hypothetical protein
MRSHLLRRLGILSVALGCGSDPGAGSLSRDEATGVAKASEKAGCPDFGLALDGWVRTNARFGAFSLPLPPESKVQNIVSTGGGVGETWRADAITIFYRIRREAPFSLTDSSGVEDLLECRDIFGGRPVNVLSYYSEETTVPGQFVFGTWELDHDSLLTVHAQSPNRDARDSLLSMLRAVRFR